MTDPISLSALTPSEQLAIAKVVERFQFKRNTITFAHGVNTRENYGSEIYRVVIHGDTWTTPNATVKVIIKRSSKCKTYRAYTGSNKIFQREIFMYEHVLPEFARMQQRKNIRDGFDNYPTYLFGSLENLGEFLMLNDKCQDGFRMHRRQTPLNFEHCALVVKYLARFHALSFAIKDQNPNLFGVFAKNCLESLYYVVHDLDDYRDSVNKLMALALAALDEDDRVVYERFAKFAKRFFEDSLELNQLHENEPFLVISHGDCWNNNILFKYENCQHTNKPSQVCFVDFQISQMTSPIVDLSHFIYTCASEKVLKFEFEQLLRIYYLNIRDFIAQLGSDPDVQFPFGEFKRGVNNYFKYGLLIACCMTQTIVNDQDLDALKNLENKQIFDSLAFGKLTSKNNRDEFGKRLRPIIRNAVFNNFI